MSLASTIIKNIPFEELIDLIYSNINLYSLSLEEFQEKDYRDLYRADVVATSKDATREFYRRLGISRSKWKSIWSLLDAILLILVTRDILVTNRGNSKKAYYWRYHDSYYQVYLYGGLEEVYTMEEALGILLNLGNTHPIRVESTTIEPKARAILKSLTQDKNPKAYDFIAERGNHTVDTTLALAPPPLNKFYGNLIMSEKGELIMIGRDNNKFILEGDGWVYEEDEVILGLYTKKEDISIITAVLDYNVYISGDKN